MGHHEKEHETKLTVKRPLMVADLIEYRGFQFLSRLLIRKSLHNRSSNRTSTRIRKRGRKHSGQASRDSASKLRII